MRERKFRAWTGVKMEYSVVCGAIGSFYVNPGAKGDGLDEKDTASISPFNTKYWPGTPIMQFTGLHDRNGHEAYEGDKVRITYDGKPERAYDEWHFSMEDPVCLILVSPDGSDRIEWFQLMWHAEFEITGNIYDQTGETHE